MQESSFCNLSAHCFYASGTGVAQHMVHNAEVKPGITSPRRGYTPTGYALTGQRQHLVAKDDRALCGVLLLTQGLSAIVPSELCARCRDLRRHFTVPLR